ncbi:hypothetical protein Nepgr_001048 [Nepenthes gracilis]|uniref:Uncharacterized protein n=1 Tax=Nepenthes gracilis TaxID=150966 RepID=A0AAD3RWN7_NEPGR|nr:hypothetical protein Nepgr_001048 [Nepenthes gracilis]
MDSVNAANTSNSYVANQNFEGVAPDSAGQMGSLAGGRVGLTVEMVNNDVVEIAQNGASRFDKEQLHHSIAICPDQVIKDAVSEASSDILKHGIFPVVDKETCACEGHLCIDLDPLAEQMGAYGGACSPRAEVGSHAFDVCYDDVQGSCPSLAKLMRNIEELIL